MRLQTSTWVEVQEYFKTHDAVVIPVGSTESHGSHLALGTDFLIPTALTDYVEEKCEVLITPTIPFGVGDAHSCFPGTLTIGYDGLHMLIKKLTDQLYRMGARKFIFLNGHGGNNPVFTNIGMDLSANGALATVVNWWSLAGDLNPAWKGGHGGGEETAAMLAIHPEGVKMQYYMPRDPQDLSDELTCRGMNTVAFRGVDMMVPRLFGQFSGSGWYGADDPKDATAAWGREMLETTGAFIADFINAFLAAPIRGNGREQSFYYSHD